MYTMHLVYKLAIGIYTRLKYLYLSKSKTRIEHIGMLDCNRPSSDRGPETLGIEFLSLVSSELHA